MTSGGIHGLGEDKGGNMGDDVFKSTEGVLYNYNQLKAEIHNLQLEIEELQDDYQGPGAINYSEKTGSTNKVNDFVFNEVLHREQLINRLERVKRTKERLLSKINIAIDSLDENERHFIETRYMSSHKRSWEQVGAIMNLDPNYCCNHIRHQVINKLSCLIFMNQYK